MLHLEERLRMGDEIMKTYIYEGGFGIVAKSGVGSAIRQILKKQKAGKRRILYTLIRYFRIPCWQPVWQKCKVRKSSIMDIQRWRTSGTLLSVPTVSHLFLRNGSVSATVLEI